METVEQNEAWEILSKTPENVWNVVMVMGPSSLTLHFLEHPAGHTPGWEAPQKVL